MEHLARPENTDDFGVALTRFIETENSTRIIAPLQKFMDDSRLTRDLRSPIKATRSALIADIAYFMNISHGRLPGIVDHAASKIVDDCARLWLVQSINAFTKERAYLNHMAVAAGPIRRMVGQDKVTALIENQTKSFEMLATSDRHGCAAGAAISFILDWQATRPFLDTIALAIGIEPRPQSMPSRQDSQNLIYLIGSGETVQRAMTFGAEQTLAQQRGLWHLIAARHTERALQQ